MFTVAPVPFPQAQQQINSPAHTDIVEPSQGNSSDGNTASPDVVLYIQRLTANGQDQLQFSYLWPQEAQLDMTMAGTITLNNVETWAQGQYAELSKSAHFMPTGDGSDAAAVQRAARALEKIGENLYDMLFPAPLKAFYKQFAPKARTVLIYSTEPWIPWEIIKPYGLDLDSDCCEFLCARFQVARWLTSEQSKSVPRRVTVHQLCPIIPSSNLVAAQKESAYIKSLPQVWPPLTLCTPPPGDADEVLEALSAGTANLFHIATHANFSPADPTKATIQMGTSQITPADLTGNKILRGLTTSRPFVCINACHSGRIGLALSGIGGWVDKLLRCGCSGFLGTNWEAQDDLAAQFAIAFYTGLQQGHTFGEACQRARLQIRAANPGNSTWLAYVLYAHPNGTMQTG
jgi:hypothetical protein